MLLKCPHCDDEANIPNALSQYENMPIACHACGGFFFAPPPDLDNPLDPNDPPDPDNPPNPNNPPPRDRQIARSNPQIARSNRQIECAQCDIPVLIPDIDAANARHKFSCPACHADLPPLPPEVKPPPKLFSASRPAAKPRTHMSISLLAIAIAIGIGIAHGVLLSRNMIALDLEGLATLSDQLGQRFILFWHQILAKLSAAI